jgi:HSP20 family molecular chaperone IbpA
MAKGDSMATYEKENYLDQIKKMEGHPVSAIIDAYNYITMSKDDKDVSRLSFTKFLGTEETKISGINISIPMPSVSRQQVSARTCANSLFVSVQSKLEGMYPSIFFPQDQEYVYKFSDQLNMDSIFIEVQDGVCSINIKFNKIPEPITKVISIH